MNLALFKNITKYLYCYLGIVVTATLISCNPLGIDSDMGRSQNSNNNNSGSRLPVISRAIPDVGDIVGGTSLSIRGAYFENGSKIYIGDAECLNIQFVAASEIQCVSPSSPTAERVDIKVVNPNADEYTLTDGYEYVVTNLTITGPNNGVDFTTAEQGQMVHGTCTRNITSLSSNIGTFVDSDCSDGTWSLQTYTLDLGLNTFTVAGNTTDGEASANDSIGITYTGGSGSVGFIQIDSPNGGVNFSTNVQTQTLSGTCSTDIVNLSSNLGATVYYDHCSIDGTWSLDPFMMPVSGPNNFVISGQDGNGDAISDSISINYDHIAPAFAISGPHGGTDFTTSDISQTVHGTCGTDVVNITVLINGVPGGVSDADCSNNDWSLAPYPLSPGANVFTVTGYDEAGNSTSASMTITYDNGNYSIEILQPNNGLNSTTNTASQTLYGTCTPGLTNLSSTLGATFAAENCGIGGNGTWSLHPYTLSSSGTDYTFTISGLTPAGNTVSDTIVITYDTAAPAVAINGTSFVTDQQVQTVTGTCGNDVVNLTANTGHYIAENHCSDTGPLAGTWSLTPTVLDPGPNTFTITAYDSAGNHADASIVITYHNIPSALQVTAPNGGSNFTTNVSTQTVTGTCTTNVTNLTVNGGRTFSDADCTADGHWALNSVSLVYGDNTFTIEGDDDLGHHLTTTQTINYDNLPPYLTIDNPSSDLTTNVIVQTVSGSCGDDVVSMTTLQGTSFASIDCAATHTWSLNAKVLNVGSNVFTITAYDAAGNATVLTRTIIYDNVPAELHITSPNGGASFTTNSALQSIYGTCTTDVINLSVNGGYTFNSADCSTGTWSLTQVALATGPNTITVSGYDNMGNPLSDSITITYDGLAPTVSIDSPSNSGTYITHSIIETVSGSCGSDVVSMTSSNGAFQHMTCSTTQSWSLYPFLLEQGDNLFNVIAFDQAGNFSNSTLTITYNYVPSSLRITGPNNGSNFTTNVNSQIIHGTCSDDMHNLSSSPGTVDVSTCAINGEWSLQLYDQLIAGDNVFTISGKDYLGNTLTDSITINYNTTAPDITIAEPHGGTDFITGQQVQTISGTCSSEVTSVTMNNDVLVSSDCANPLGGTWSSGPIVLASGVNTFTATAHTAAGNTADKTITITYNYTPSSLQITNPNNGLSYTTNVQSQSIHGTCSTDMKNLSTSLPWVLSDSDCTNGTWSLATDNLVAGDNVITISGKDYLGNTLTKTMTITYDSTSPSITIQADGHSSSYTTSLASQTVSGTCSADVTSITTNKGALFTSDCAGAGTWQLWPFVLSVGENTFNVIATNAAGTSANASITITYDNHTYSLNITHPNGGTSFTTNVASQHVYGTCTSGITGLTSSLGTFANSDCTTGAWELNPYTMLTSGHVYTFTVSGTDPAANPVSSTMAITYDTTPPTVTISSPVTVVSPSTEGSVSTYTSIPTISGSCIDVVSMQTTNGSFANGGCSGGSWSLNPAVMNSGINNFTITGTDVAGNTDIKTVHITYYPTPASIHITNPSTTLYTNTLSHTVSGTCTHEITNLTTTAGTFTDSGCSDGTWSLNTTSLSAGLNTITVSGKDAVNNTVSASVGIYYDTLAPTLSITDPNVGADLTTNVLVQTVFGLCGTDVTNITTSLGSFADSNCLDGTWSLNPKVMSLGINTFTITAYDASGNFTTATIHITFDDIPPTAPTVSATSPTANTTPTWSWVAGGGGNGNFRYKLDDADLTSGATATTSLSYTPGTPIAIGVHTLYVQERDDAGNWSTSGTKAVTIEACNALQAFGKNQYGQLGIADAHPLYYPTPTDVPNLTNITKVVASNNFTIAKKSDGTLWAWGNNDSGQLGIGDTGTRGTPQQVSGLGGITIADVCAGNSFAIALDNTGSVWTWGAPASNQMGDNTLTTKVLPAQNVYFPAGITKINTSLGASHSLAIASDHTVWAWGLNTSGQLGDGTAQIRATPVQVADTISSVLTVSSVVVTSATTITVTTTGNHNLAPNHRIVMAGWTGTGINGTFLIATVPNNTSFTYTTSGASGTPTGGTATAYLPSVLLPFNPSLTGYGSITGSGTTVTVTTSANYLHGLTTGQKVVMAGWTGTGGNFNGTYEITVTSTSTFTYAATGTGTPTGGTIIVNGGTGALSNVIDVAAGTTHSVALKADGTVWAWGPGSTNQLGNNVLLASYSPLQVQVSGGAALTNVTAISAGTNFSLARKSDGTLWAWGLGTSGQLGDGTTISKNYAVQVSGGLLTNVSNNISAGDTHALAVKADGTLWAWGNDASGQLGDGGYASRSTPYQVLSNANQASAGNGYSAMTTTGNTVKVWGMDLYLQFGITEEYKTTPTPVYNFENTPVLDISGGTSTSSIVKLDRTAWATGVNGSGQLGVHLPTSSVTGNGSLVTVTTTFPHGLVNFTQVTMSGCTGGSGTWNVTPFVTVTGANTFTYAATGNGTATGCTVIPTEENTFTQIRGVNDVGFLTNVSKVRMGSYCGLVLNNDQTVYGLGQNVYGQLGDGTVTIRTTPVYKVADVVSKSLNINTVTVTSATVITVTTTGNHNIQPASRVTMSGWTGAGVNGTFLVQTTASTNTFTYTTSGASGPATGGTATVEQPSVQLLTSNVAGNGTTVTVNTNTAIPNFSTGNKVQVVMGGWSGGSGNWNGTYEVTGTGTNSFTYTATGNGTATGGTAILNGGTGALSGVIDIAAGTTTAATSIAVKSDGTVWTWGANTYGELGNGLFTTMAQTSFPTQVLTSAGTPLTGIIAVSSALYNMLALKSDGTVWAWGNNTYGQIGDGTIGVQRNFAVKVLNLTNVVNINTAYLSSFAVKGDGTIWAWGYNGAFGLGDGTTSSKNFPVQVVGINNAIKVVSAPANPVPIYALKSDGTVWAWGAGNYGQFGDGESGYYRLLPTKIPGLSHVVNIAVGDAHVITSHNCSY